MISVLGIFSLVLRLVLGFHAEAQYFFHAEEGRICLEASKDHGTYLVDFTQQSTSAEGILDSEKSEEERFENEFEADLPHFNTDLYSISLISYWDSGEFSNKPKRGSLPPLYDFFHCWKSQLV